MAAVTSFLGESLPASPATRRAGPRVAVTRARRPSPGIRRRRRLAAVGLALGLVAVAARAGDALGGSPLAAPERRPTPARASVVEVRVRAGDSLWAIVARAFPADDPRPRVDALVRARRGAPLTPGETVQIPR